MDIHISHFEGSCIIAVVGEIDLYNAYRLKDAVSAVQKEKICAFIVDLKEVTYIDSSGIGALLWIHSQLAKKGLRFSIVRVPPAVMKVMKLTRLIGFLPIEKTQAEAPQKIADSCPRSV